MSTPQASTFRDKLSRMVSSAGTYLWPIYRSELRKFLPLFFMAFFIGFNYNILRNMKEACLVTAEEAGAVVIPFIKVWGMIPGAFLMTFVYSRLNNRLTRQRVFYAMIVIFLAFFALFTFVVYPVREFLHPDAKANALQALLPEGCKGLVAMWRYWTFSAFYIMSDLWSSTILSMLFWGYANEVTKLVEAKRFYGLIAIGLNIAAIVSGQVSAFLSQPRAGAGEDPWQLSLQLLTTVVLISGVIIMLLYHWSARYEEREERKLAEAAPPKIRMSMRSNFRYLWDSKYLLLIAIIVLSYNMVISFVEVLWKEQVNTAYPNPNDYNAYMSQVTTMTGVVSLISSLLVSGPVIRCFGWTFTALLTPTILLLTSIGFFTFLLGQGDVLGVAALVGATPLALVVFFGSVQNCLCRAAKFTLFDATKEMAFIPLTPESRLKGKAAIDGVGSRLGKSGGSMVLQGLLMGFSSVGAAGPLVGGVLLAVISVWMVAVRNLGKRFHSFETPATLSEAPAEVATPAA